MPAIFGKFAANFINWKFAKNAQILAILLTSIFGTNFAHFESDGQRQQHTALKNYLLNARMEGQNPRGHYHHHSHNLMMNRPEKLQRGCPRELLQINGFRQFPLVCRTQPSLAIVAYEGILDAMDECRRQMRFERWDCSQPATVLHEPTITKHAFPETAYLWAMSAAGVAWGIATGCAQGWLDECKCVPNDGGQRGAGANAGMWDWAGCSYGVQYGVVSSRKLLTRTGSGGATNFIGNGGGHSAGGQISRHLLRKLEKHNLKVGRMAVKRTLVSSCKCHGVSGSCQQKTCWKKPADLKAVAKHLSEKLKTAKIAQFLPGGKINARNSDLIFLERSMDLCSQFHYDVHQKRSLPRVCSWRNATHSQGDCTDLCCGLGYSVSHEVVPYKCDCKFVWCCRLECRDCLEHRWISTCNT